MQRASCMFIARDAWRVKPTMAFVLDRDFCADLIDTMVKHFMTDDGYVHIDVTTYISHQLQCYYEDLEITEEVEELGLVAVAEISAALDKFLGYAGEYVNLLPKANFVVHMQCRLIIILDGDLND